MNKVKVGILIGTLNRAGAQNVVLNLCKFLDKTKFDVSLIFWRKEEYFDEFKKIKNLKLIQLENKPKDKKATFLKKLPIFIKQQKELREIQKREKFDIIHSHLIFSNIHASLLKRRYKDLIIISTRHNSGAFRKKLIYRWLIHFFSKNFDQFIAISNYVKNFTKRYESLNNIKVYYNGTDIQKIDSITNVNYPFMDKKNFNIISVGRLIEQKGYSHLIKAFKKFYERNHNSRLFICGDGKERNKITSLIKNMGLEKEVQLLGVRYDIFALLKSSDVFALLSDREGLGIVFLEAMACHLPVIGSNIGGIKELIKNKKNGYLVNLFDYDKTALFFEELKNKPILREKMGNEGYNIVKMKFNVKMMVKNYEQTYTLLVNKKGKI